MAHQIRTKLCIGLWAFSLLQTSSALTPPGTELHGATLRDTRRQLVVSSESIQDGTVRATTILPRRDPLNSLRLYREGFNMKDKHYWSSVTFTGVWAFSMAFVCFVAGITMSLWWCCGKDSGMTSILPAQTDVLRGLYCFCIVQFSILAVTSSGVIFWGAYQSAKEIKDSTNVIVSQVNQESVINSSSYRHPNNCVHWTRCNRQSLVPGTESVLCGYDHHFVCVLGIFRSLLHSLQDYRAYRCAEDVVLHCFELNTPIPKSYYTEFIVLVSAAKEVIKLLPSLYSIMTCSFINSAFQDLTFNHCSSIEAAFNTLWIGFAAASVAMMCVQVMWLAIREHLTLIKDFKLAFMYSPS